MARNGFAKVFDFEGTLEAGSEETAEGCNEGGESCEDKDVKLHGCDVNGGRYLEGGWEREIGKVGGNVVGLMYENRIWGAGEAGEYVRAEVLIDSQLGERMAYGLGCYTFTGQMKYLYRINTFVIAKPNMIVQIHAPTKPSTVFFGESFMS